MIKSLLIPTHPTMGWVSMNRYFLEISNTEIKNISFTSPFAKELFIRPKVAGRISKIYARTLHYPYKLLAQQERDINHILDHSFVDLMRWPQKAPTVITVHDLIPLGEFSTLPPNQKRRFHRRIQYLKQADHLICCSEYTAREVETYLQISRDKMSVVPHGVNRGFMEKKTLSRDLQEKIPQGKKVIVIVGGTIYRKNHAILPEVVKGLQAFKGEYCIVKVGPQFHPQLRETIAESLGQSNIIELGFLSERDLQSVLQTSTLLFFPSLIEGFGLPVLEAMAAGCPVVCSERSSLPEVGGTAVLYFDPQKPQEASQAIEQVFRDENFRIQLVKEGVARAQTFTWEAHVAALAKIYKNVLNGQST